MIFKVKINADLIALEFNGCWDARYFQVKLKAHDFLMDQKANKSTPTERFIQTRKCFAEKVCQIINMLCKIGLLRIKIV